MKPLFSEKERAETAISEHQKGKDSCHSRNGLFSSQCRRSPETVISLIGDSLA